jgi:hypothetical protein
MVNGDLSFHIMAAEVFFISLSFRKSNDRTVVPDFQPSTFLKQYTPQ